MESCKTDNGNGIQHYDHHTQLQVCTTRAKYRQGKEFKAVKVYTINNESKHLLIQNVPSIGLIKEVTKLVSKFGKFETVRLANEYPSTVEFTHVYYVKYRLLRDARQAKKRLDNRSFYGNLLHICYAPELECKEECRQKIFERVCSSDQKTNKNRNSHMVMHHSQNKGSYSQSHLPHTQQVEPTSESEGMWHNLLPVTASRVITRQKHKEVR